MNWKAYDEVHFSDQYILRWVREGDEYVNRISKEMMEDLHAVVRQQQAEYYSLLVNHDKLYAKVVEQQAEIEALKTCLIVEQEHNELMVEDRSKYEALAHAGGVEVGKELKTLTDEEIFKLWQKHLNDEIPVFARAILKKAQNK